MLFQVRNTQQSSITNAWLWNSGPNCHFRPTRPHKIMKMNHKNWSSSIKCISIKLLNQCVRSWNGFVKHKPCDFSSTCFFLCWLYVCQLFQRLLVLCKKPVQSSVVYVISWSPVDLSNVCIYIFPMYNNIRDNDAKAEDTWHQVFFFIYLLNSQNENLVFINIDCLQTYWGEKKGENN